MVIMRIKWLFVFLLLNINQLHGVDPFVVVTAERSGTHLLTRALTFLTEKKVIHVWERNESISALQYYLAKVEYEGAFFHMHAFPYRHIVEFFESRGYKVIFQLRDPRDQLLSVLNYIRDFRWEYGPLRMDFPFGELSFDEQIDEMITGQRFGICVPKEFISKRLAWMNLENTPCFTTRFERLVGAKGGGNRELQLEELAKLASFLNIEITQERLGEIADDLFAGPALRKGQINSWKAAFTKKHKKHFKENYGQELINLGYEKDLKW